MNCDKCPRLLPDYLGRGLDADLASELGRHLAGCPDCQAELESLRRVFGLLAQEPSPAMPVSEERFLQDIRRRLRQPRPARRAWFPRWAPVFAAAAALLIALGTYQLLHQATVRPGAGFSEPDLSLYSESDFLGFTADTSLVLSSSDIKSLDGLDQELVDDADIDDLFDELSGQEQLELVRALQAKYSYHNGG